MNSLLKNIIEKSATGILIYAGKRLIDKGIICWDERKKKKEAIPADHTAEKSDKTITPVSMKEIIERNKPQSAVSHQRGLFAPGELHVICAQTGMGKSIFSVEMGLAMAGGKESEPYAIVKSILGDKWDATKHFPKRLLKVINQQSAKLFVLQKSLIMQLKRAFVWKVKSLKAAVLKQPARKKLPLFVVNQ